MSENRFDGWALAAPEEPTPALAQLAEIGVLKAGVYSNGRRYYEVLSRSAWPQDNLVAEREDARRLIDLVLDFRGCGCSEDHE